MGMKLSSSRLLWVQDLLDDEYWSNYVQCRSWVDTFGIMFPTSWTHDLGAGIAYHRLPNTYLCMLVVDSVYVR